MTVLSFKTEAEWLEARRKYVTSTEVSAIFGQNPRLTAFELFHLKRDPKLDTFEGTERTEWGKALQETIGIRVAVTHGIAIRALDLQLAIHNRCAASGDFMIDRIVDRSVGGKLQDYALKHGPGVLEIKNVDSLIYKNDWSDTDMPDHIEIQLQAEMLCWDVKWGVVAVLVGGNRLELYIRERDEIVCRMIDGHAQGFMRRLEHNEPPPPVMPEDAGMVIALNQYAEPNKVLDGSSNQLLHDAVKDYKHAKKVASDFEKEAECHKADILSLIGDAERVINIPGFNLSASMRADVQIPAHIRKGYRDLRITERKDGRKD